MTETRSPPAQLVLSLRWWAVISLRVAGLLLRSLAVLRFGALLVDAPYRSVSGRGAFPYANVNDRPIRDAITGAALLALAGWAARYILPAPGGVRSRYIARGMIRGAALALLTVALWNAWPEGREAWRYFNTTRFPAGGPSLAYAIGRFDVAGPSALLGALLLLAQRPLTLLIAPARPGGCVNCGYQLEESQPKCPECGYSAGVREDS